MVVISWSSFYRLSLALTKDVSTASHRGTLNTCNYQRKSTFHRSSCHRKQNFVTVSEAITVPTRTTQAPARLRRERISAGPRSYSVMQTSCLMGIRNVLYCNALETITFTVMYIYINNSAHQIQRSTTVRENTLSAQYGNIPVEPVA